MAVKDKTSNKAVWGIGCSSSLYFGEDGLNDGLTWKMSLQITYIMSHNY